MSQLPTEIGNLIQIRTLHINHNPIISFPSEIGLLVNLESLYHQSEQIAWQIKKKYRPKNITITKVHNKHNIDNNHKYKKIHHTNE